MLNNIQIRQIPRLIRCASQTRNKAENLFDLKNVKGLSNKCIKPVNGLVGPGASTTAEYKVPEYFCFNRFSYAEAEVELAKYRCPQPSALKK